MLVLATIRYFLKKCLRELIYVLFCFRFLWISRRPGMLNWEQVFFWLSKNLYKQCDEQFLCLKVVKTMRNGGNINCQKLTILKISHFVQPNAYLRFLNTDSLECYNISANNIRENCCFYSLFQIWERYQVHTYSQT